MKANRITGLIIVIVAPAVIGGWLGWHYPHFSLTNHYWNLEKDDQH